VDSWYCANVARVTRSTDSLWKFQGSFSAIQRHVCVILLHISQSLLSLCFMVFLPKSSAVLAVCTKDVCVSVDGGVFVSAIMVKPRTAGLGIFPVCSLLPTLADSVYS
jgi:hypothetical protein